MHDTDHGNLKKGEALASPFFLMFTVGLSCVHGTHSIQTHGCWSLG